MYEKLFTEGRINGCTIRNRVVLAPMDDCLGQASGEITQRGIEYYANKAKGGCGLVIVGYVGFMGPEMAGAAMSGQTFLMNYDQRHAMSLLAERVHEYGGKVFVQLNHPGRKTSRGFNQGHEPVSSSAMTPDLEKRNFAPCHELTIEEIHQVEDACAEAALHAFRAGIDGVEIHCAHYFLFNQFLTPSRNARTDEYGGSMENRCRIVVETIDKIYFPYTHMPEQTIEHQLELCNVKPEDIDYLVISHLHWDHAGNIGKFKNAKVVVQRDEMSYALLVSHTVDPKGTYFRKDVDVDADWMLIDGDFELADGVRLLRLPGHCEGLQGIQLTLDSGTMLMTSDACYTACNWGPPVRPTGAVYDSKSYNQSIAKLKNIAAVTNATVIYGHDIEQFRSLKRAPQFYE